LFILDVRTRQAVHVLSGGGIIAYPTEAVWGLGCDPLDELAVGRLLDLKNRPPQKGLILVAASLQQFEWILCDLTAAQQSRLELSWPGATTWLVPHRGRVPTWIYGDHDTVALRVSEHPLVQQLCQAWGGPLVSTSANMAGCQPAREQYQVRRYFGDGVDYLLPGTVGAGRGPSMIRDLLSDKIIRPG
jgi:L-threonylcarbamoyladenylate synthase